MRDAALPAPIVRLAPPPAAAVAEPRVGHPILMFLIGASLAGSSAGEMRVDIGGLRTHPAILVAVVAFLLAGTTRVKLFPKQLLGALAFFCGAFALASFAGEEPFYTSAVLKLVATCAVIVMVASIPARFDDINWGVTGMMVGVGVIAAVALVTGDVGSEMFNPLKQGYGNKNAFSLFTLPALLLGMETLIRERALPKRIPIIAGALMIVLATFVSANRSGWVGVAAVPVLLFLMSRGRRMSTLIASVLVALLALYLLDNYLDVGAFERRLNQTVEGYHSDELREQLFQQCFWIGVDHPLLGVGPLGITFELARRIDPNEEYFGPHNAITYLFGAGGIILFGAFVMVGRTLLQAARPLKQAGARLSIAHAILMMWVLRAFFTDEALYAPAFAIAFGLVLARVRFVAPPAPAAPPVRPKPPALAAVR